MRPAEGTFVCPSCQGTGYVESPSHFYNTFWALPIVAIALALITKGGLFLPLYWDCSGRTALRQLWL